MRTIATAWETAVLKAHGVPITRTKTHTLTPDTRAAYQRINLHFHDLRHEAGSRFLEAGWPLHHVKDMLGHADIKTTDTYLNVTRIGLAESMKKLDEARIRCKPVASDTPSEHPLPCNADQPDEGKAVVH
jgi:integrase